MKNITHHIILNPKGGTCKTRTAIFLASYYKSKGMTTNNYDTDIIVKNFSKFKKLNCNLLSFDKKETITNWQNLLEDSKNDTITDIGGCYYSQFLYFLTYGNFLKKINSQTNQKLIFHIPFINSINTEFLSLFRQNLINYESKNIMILPWLHYFTQELDKMSDKEPACIRMPRLSELEMELLTDSFKKHRDLDDKEYFEELSCAPKLRYRKMVGKILAVIEENSLLAR